MNLEGQYNIYPINVVGHYSPDLNARHMNMPNSKDRIGLTAVLDKYIDKNTLSSLIYSNPELLTLLKENNLPVKINSENFKKNVYNHSVNTRKTAIGIYSKLSAIMQSECNIRDISYAALMHDIGKILIPEKILNKKGSLTEDEKRIMQLHSDIGYELLKNSELSDNAKNIIKNHHKCENKPGNINDINTQIVSLADKYSALREKRSYKAPMTEKQAMDILHDEIDKGVSADVYNALYDYVISSSNKKNTSTLSNYLGIKNSKSSLGQNKSYSA